MGKLNAYEKYLFLYFISNPHTHLSGIYYLPMPLIICETGLSEQNIKKGIDTLSSAGRVRIDLISSVIWVKNMLRYQGSGPKVIKGVANQLATLHNSPLINEFLAHYADLNIPFEAQSGYPIEGVSSVGPQDQDQDQDQEQDPPKAPQGAGKNIPPSVEEVRAYVAEMKYGIDPENFVDFYTSKNWMIGKNKMKDWHAATRTWERKRKEESPNDNGRAAPVTAADFQKRLDAAGEELWTDMVKFQGVVSAVDRDFLGFDSMAIYDAAKAGDRSTETLAQKLEAKYAEWRAAR